MAQEQLLAITLTTIPTGAAMLVVSCVTSLAVALIRQARAIPEVHPVAIITAAVQVPHLAAKEAVRQPGGSNIILENPSV